MCNPDDKRDFRGECVESSRKVTLLVAYSRLNGPRDIHCRQSQFSNARLPGQSEWLLIVHGCHGRTSVSPLVGKAPGPAGFGLSGNFEHLRWTLYSELYAKYAKIMMFCGHYFVVVYI